MANEEKTAEEPSFDDLDFVEFTITDEMIASLEENLTHERHDGD